MASELVELVGDLGEWTDKVKEWVEEAVKEGTKTQIEAIVETAKDLVPVDSGNLRENIEGVISPAGKDGLVRVQTKKAYYGFMVHFGTEKMTGRPFLYQAAERHGATEYTEKIKEILEQKAENG